MSRSGSFAYRKAKIVPDNLLAFPPSLVVIVRGVSICPWMDGSRTMHRYMDVTY